MDRVLEVLAKYNVTPLQLSTLVSSALEYHLDDIEEGILTKLYPVQGEELMDELNALSWRLLKEGKR
jgi:hypothetical protein